MTIVTPEIDYEAWREQGFIIIDQLLERRHIPELHEAFDDLFHGRFETGVRPDEVNWQHDTSDPSLTRQICNGWKADRRIARVVLDESLGKLIGSLKTWPRHAKRCTVCHVKAS